MYAMCGRVQSGGIRLAVDDHADRQGRLARKNHPLSLHLIKTSRAKEAYDLLVSGFCDRI